MCERDSNGCKRYVWHDVSKSMTECYRSEEPQLFLTNWLLVQIINLNLHIGESLYIHRNIRYQVFEKILKALLTARFGRPTPQLIRQYTTPTRRWITDTKLYKVRNGNPQKLPRLKKLLQHLFRIIYFQQRELTMDMGNSCRPSCWVYWI